MDVHTQNPGPDVATSSQEEAGVGNEQNGTGNKLPWAATLEHEKSAQGQGQQQVTNPGSEEFGDIICDSIFEAQPC